MIKRLLSIAVCALPLAACATLPSARSHQYVAQSSAGTHLGLQITMHTGVANTPQQTVMLIYRQDSKTPIAIVEGQTKAMSEELMAQVINIFGGVATGATAAAISGGYMLQAAQVNCPPGTLCGTLVQIQNTAGATAGAEAESSSN